MRPSRTILELALPKHHGKGSRAETEAEVKVFNASGRPIYLYQGPDAKPSLSIYQTMRPMVDRYLVETGLSVGVEVLDEEFEVPLTLVKYRAILGMPPQRDGVAHVVSYEVAHAAEALGRTDCYLTVDLVSTHTGAGVGFQRFGRLG